MINDPITVGVLTHNRAASFETMLHHLKVAMQSYEGECSLIVANNSGLKAHAQVNSLVERSSISEICKVSIIDSPKNSIAIGRNLVLDSVKTRLLLFIDDDEFPDPQWIVALVNQYKISKTMAIAGPIEPIFPDSAPGWVRAIDLHNKGTRKTGDNPSRTATGNCLLDMEQVGDVRMDLEFGLIGGEDGAFFQTLGEQGKTITWSGEAIVYETISKNRGTSRYNIFRFMAQGQTYAKVVLRKRSFSTRWFSFCRAAAIALVCIPIACIVMPFNDRQCASFMKRGFSNLGKVMPLSKPLYGRDGSY